MAKPIIGPPEIIFTGTSAPSVFKLKTSGIRSLTIVPTGTLMFTGLTTAPPLIVRALSTRGRPARKASLIAHTVPTLEITQPASAGSFALGISRPVAADTMNFSAPCGYFVFTRQTDILSA